jgi:hypothetical protein
MSWIVRTCYLMRMRTQHLPSLSKNHVARESQSRNEVKKEATKHPEHHHLAPTLEEILLLAIAHLIASSTRVRILNRLALDDLLLARRLDLLHRALLIIIPRNLSSSSSALLRGRCLGSLHLRRPTDGNVTSLGRDLLLDLGPGVGSGDGVGHAG